MSIPVVTFFNNKGGVGKTSLVYHLSWMLSEMGHSVVAVDLDPQANLTSAFLTDEWLDHLWNHEWEEGKTIFRCLEPLIEVGDILEPVTVKLSERLHLVPGDLNLAGFEDALSGVWPEALGSGNLFRPFRLLSSFWQVAQKAAKQHQANLILVDVGPNLGAINRSALIATDYVVVPLAADLFSLQALKNLGPTLERWRTGWKDRLSKWSKPKFELPQGRMQPLGYVLLQHIERLSRPIKAYERWLEKIPEVYLEFLKDPPQNPQLGQIRHYRSLVPLAQEARKPVFQLTPADGAIGSHAAAAKDAQASFRSLAEVILKRIV